MNEVLTRRELAEASWRWVLDQVHCDDGPWVPASVTEPPATAPAWDRDGMHSGIGGLALALSEVRRTRPWSADEDRLAEAIATRVRAVVAGWRDCTFFDGLVSALGVFVALDAPGADEAVARLGELATPDGWPQNVVVPPKYLPDARLNDLTLGTAGVLVGALWADRAGVAGAQELAGTAADVLLREAEPAPGGTTWPFVPRRFLTRPGEEMPNLSHGAAGVATALALAGAELGRPELVDAARGGAEHVVSLGDMRDGGLVVPRSVPPVEGYDEVTFGWCHGPTGTSLLFPALERAGVEQVAGAPPSSWQRRCLHSVRTSGLPARLHPGFWDNDGRCCGTAGVGDVFLDAWHRGGDTADLEFARHLGDVLAERAVVEGPHAWWRFVEHRAEQPLLPPGVGWMQGAAGIAAFLFHLDRVEVEGSAAEAVPRMDSWWAVGP